jgi:hypothetical protein
MITRKLIAALMAGAMIVGSAQGTSAAERTWYYGSAFTEACEIIGAPDVIYRLLTSSEIGLKRVNGLHDRESTTDADGNVWVTLEIMSVNNGPIGLNFFTSKEKCERWVQASR